MKVKKDILWKPAIEDFFEYLLYFFFPELVNQVDFNKGFDFLDKEIATLFPSENPRHPKFVDKLVRVFLKSGEEKWFLIHIEVQGYRQKIFPERMFRYFYRIWDKYNNDVMSLAIYLDKKGPANSQMYKYRVGDTCLDFNFKRYYIGDQREEELYRSTNPFALVILTALTGLKRGLKDEQLLELKYNLVKRLMQIKLTREKIHRLLGFINSYLNFEDNQMDIKFAERIEPVTTIKNTSMGILETLAEEAKRQGKILGIKEGKKEGKIQGRREGRKEGREEGMNKGIREGIREGKIEGKKEGRKEGKKEGKKEGRRIALLSTAKKMLKEKASISFIHKCTGLPKTQISRLIKAA